jgi:signal transduction histidine kinase/CheY-like chemotaxis protein
MAFTIRRRLTWKVAMLAVLTVAVGVGEGYFARSQYDARRAETFHAWEERLRQSVEDRARLIEPWAAGVVSGCQVVAAYPSVVELLAAAPVRDRQATERHATSLLETFVRLQGYRALLVSDRSGALLLGAGDPLPSELLDSARRATLSTGGRMIDFFISGGRPYVVAGVSVPLGVPAADVDGVVLLVSDPDWLYQGLLRDSPSARTGEHLLVRGAGTAQVLLSPPREFVRPIPVHAFPPVRGADGSEGFGAGVDHRGATVIRVLRPVHGTPWTVVSKVDRSEIDQGIRAIAIGVLVQTLTYLVLVLAIVFALLRHRHAIYVSHQLESADQIKFLNGLLLTISEVNELMVREKDRQRLLDETCRIIVQHGGFRMAWLGEVQTPRSVRPVASAGAVEDYLRGLDIRLDDLAMGRGPTGRAIMERRTVVADDIAADARLAPWRERALKGGYRSSVAIPLFVGERVLGSLNVYSSTSGVFRGEALALLERLANDLAFVIDVMERQARHRETEQVLVVREEQLRQAQKMEAIGRLAGGVAHDFNNLLMAISGYAELALSAKTEESRRERIEEIATAADRAAALTRQLLAFSRKQVLQPRVLNLNVIVAEIEKMLRRLIGENIELVTRLAPLLDHVCADPGQLEQVIVNLVVNARDAMPDGGRLEIETENVEARPGHQVANGELEPGHYVVLVVKDTGQGMAQEVLDHLFEPFFTTKDSGKGTGLGLSMVYGIVKQSGGAVTVASEPNSGSSFSIYLPVAGVGEVPDELTAIPAAARQGGGRLLVVEDNPAVRHFVTEALTTAGYEVVDAESAERALGLLAADKEPLDLLLTDVVLPKMDGYDLARLAVAAHPSLRVIYMSGYVDSPRLRELALTEGIDLIEKPFTSAAISARVAAALERVPQRLH